MGANYLRTAGILAVEGREFSESDREGTLLVAIVNQVFVKQYFPDENPIGQRIELGAPASLITLQGSAGALGRTRRKRWNRVSRTSFMRSIRGFHRGTSRP